MNVLTESVNIEFVRVKPIVTKATAHYVKDEDFADLNIVSPMSSQEG
jgi:hypothetical protein